MVFLGGGWPWAGLEVVGGALVGKPDNVAGTLVGKPDNVAGTLAIGYRLMAGAGAAFARGLDEEEEGGASLDPALEVLGGGGLDPIGSLAPGVAGLDKDLDVTAA